MVAGGGGGDGGGGGGGGGGGASSSALLLASVDGRVPGDNLHECSRAYSTDVRLWGHSAGGWKLCGGLFFIRHGEGAKSFLRDWGRRLRAPKAGGKNQPHYNEALRASSALNVSILPCDLFPNGYRFASEAWRSQQLRRPLLVYATYLTWHVVTKHQHSSFSRGRSD